jgi:hypothetical protein
MPVKRRQLKRWRHTVARRDPKKWRMLFSCGWDYLNDLKFGFGHDAQQEARAAAASAWRDFGREYLASWRPGPRRLCPWALEFFGEPEGRTGAKGRG